MHIVNFSRNGYRRICSIELIGLVVSQVREVVLPLGMHLVEICLGNVGLAGFRASCRRRSRCATLEVPTSHELHEMANPISGWQVLRVEVGGVFLPQDLAKIYSLAPHRLLNPQKVCLEMPKLPETLPTADPDCSG
jgi:hypothetical protein